MYAAGLLEEARAAREMYPQWSRTAAQAIGYAEAFAVLDGTMTLAEAKERTVIRTRQLARRQEIYLRGQFEVTWIRGESGDTVESLANRVAQEWKL
jgi:tRNA dimethylallyltransferase